MASQRTTGDSNQVKEVPVASHWPAQRSRPGSPSGSTTDLLGNSHATSTSIPVSTWTSAGDLHPASGLHFREGSGNARKAKAAIRADVSDNSEERLLSPHSYPPSQAPDLSYNHDPHDHAPISAPTLFSRHAAPLYLPQLDKYITSLPLPAFSSHSRTKADTMREKFVPLDRLASTTGRSIEFLKTNYKGKPGWRNCNLILGGLVNTVLGVLVCVPIPRLFLCWMRPRGPVLLSRFTVY